MEDALKVYIFWPRKPVVKGTSISPSPYVTMIIFVSPVTLALGCSRCPREIRLMPELGIYLTSCSSIP